MLLHPLLDPSTKQETPVQFLGWKICWRSEGLPTPVFLGFPCGSASEESACNVGDLDLIPGLGRCPGEGNGYPLQYSDLEDSMDGMVHGVAESDMTEQPSLHFTFSCLRLCDARAPDAEQFMTVSRSLCLTELGDSCLRSLVQVQSEETGVLSTCRVT